MKNWSTSAKVTVALIVLLAIGLVARSIHYNRVARQIAHDVPTAATMRVAKPLIIKKRLARLFKERTEQAKKQAIRTAQLFAMDRTIVKVEDHHIPMAEAAAGAIVEFLSDLELPVRSAAADALCRMGKPAARPLIDSALTSPDKDVRSNATLALRTIAEVAVPEMIDAIKGGTPSQKIGCAGAIGRLKSPRAIDGLMTALSATEEDVRLACRDALVAMEEASVTALIGGLTNTNAFTRQHSAEALGEIGDATAAQPLLAAMSDTNRLVRLAATYAVGKVHASTATQPLIARLKDEDREMREAAAVSLGQIADAASVTPLIAALADPVDKVQEAAAAALGRLATSTSGSLGAIEAAASSPHESTRSAAVFALGRIGNPASLPTLTARLRDDDAVVVRERAARGLAEMRQPAAIAALLDAFDDPEWRVSYAAQEALAAIGQPAVPQLIEVLRGSDLLRSRYARKTLVRMVPPPTQALLAVAAPGQPPAARVKAVIALGEIEDDAAENALEGLANDADPKVAEAAKQGQIVRGTPAVGAESLAPNAVAPAAPKGPASDSAAAPATSSAP